MLDHNYIDGLDPVVLGEIQRRIIKSQFKDSQLDGAGNFLEFYLVNLHTLIGQPFRENAVCTMIIKNEIDGIWTVSDSLIFFCRANGNKIQNSVRWIPDEGCTPLSISISIRSKMNAAEIQLIASSNSNKDELKQLADGVAIPEDYAKDGLFVRVEYKYQLDDPKVITWAMINPTKNLNLTISYPSNFHISVECFMTSEEKVLQNNKDGLLTINYPEWILPENGLVFRFLERK